MTLLSKNVLIKLNLAVLLAANALICATRASESGLACDLAQWYVAGQFVAQGQAEVLYDQDVFRQAAIDVGSGHPYFSLYPPHVACLFAPFAALAFEALVPLYTIIQVIAFCSSIALMVGLPRSQNARLHWALAFGFFPLAYSLSLGQLSTLLLLVVVLAAVVEKTRGEFSAGLVLSLLTIKPTLFVGYWIWALVHFRQPRRILGLAVGGLAQLALVTMLLGWEVVQNYMQTVPQLDALIGNYEFAAAHQHGWKGILTQRDWALPAVWQTSLQIGFSLLALAGLISASKGRGHSASNADDSYALATLFALAIAPHLLTYDLLLLLIPVWVGLRSAIARRRTLAGVLYGGVLMTPLAMVLQVSPIPALLLIILWAWPGSDVQRKTPRRDVVMLENPSVA